MIKNYFNIFLKTAKQSKLFTSLSLFGISLTIMFIMIFSMAIEKIIVGSGPVEELKMMMFTGYVKTVGLTPNRNWTSTGGCGRVLGERYLKNIASAEVSSMYSRISSWEFILNGQLQVKYQCQTDAEFWDIFNYNFLEGRPYNREEVMSQANLAVVTRSLKELLFGDEEDVLGKTVKCNSLNLTVIGIVEDPPVTAQNAKGDLYFPYTLFQDTEGSYIGEFKMAFKAGSKKQFREIRDEVQDVIARIDAADTTCILSISGPFNRFEKILANYSISDKGKFLMIALAFILLPAVNLMAINFSRIHERFEEIAVRKSFGASSSVLRGQFLFENIIMTLSGGVIGIILSYLLVALLGNSVLRLNIMDNSLPLTFSFNIAVFVAALISCFLFSIFSGYLPAARLSRMKPAVYLKGGEI